MKTFGTLFLITMYVGISLFGLYKLKSSALGLNIDFLIGFAAYAAGFGIWLALLRALPLSIAFPLAAGSLVIGTQFVGWAALHESVTALNVIAVTFIVAGIALLAFK